VLFGFSQTATRALPWTPLRTPQLCPQPLPPGDATAPMMTVTMMMMMMDDDDDDDDDENYVESDSDNH